MPNITQDCAEIPSDVINVYQAHDMFVNSLVGRRSAESPSPAPLDMMRPIRSVGLHPFASNECKEWPDRKWLALSRELLAGGLEVTIFGAAADKDRISAIFAPVLERVRVVTVGFGAFLQKIGAVDLLIGLDSLGVHAADRAGVRTVMLVGANHKDMWAPPGAISIGQSGGCAWYPCHSRPKCIQNADRYACIRSIEVDQVIDAIRKHSVQRGNIRLRPTPEERS